MKGLKRIHLFEFEDFRWFPHGLRACMTRYIMAIHRVLDTNKDLVLILEKALARSNRAAIIDLCSGSGGPLIAAAEELRKRGHEGLTLSLSDLYPNKKAARSINDSVENVLYIEAPVDATRVTHQGGVRTLICSMHHLKPSVVHSILKDAKDNKAPIVAFEISDNSFPKWLWWTAIPINILVVLLLTPMVRPFTIQQFVFTYLIPVLPLVIAWDGAVSNARTYSMDDLDILLTDLSDSSYTWEKNTLKEKGTKLYLLGYPNE